MSRENITRRHFLRLGAGAAVNYLDNNIRRIEGVETPYPLDPDPDRPSKVIVIPNPGLENPYDINTYNVNTIAIPDPSLFPQNEDLYRPTEAIKQRIERYQREFNEYILPVISEENNNLVLQSISNGGHLGNIEDIKTYYPLFKAIEEIYTFDWITPFNWWDLWVMMDTESSMGTNPNTYNRDRTWYGPMQRSQHFWSDRDVWNVASRYQYLSQFPQSDPRDWKEIVWAADKFWNDYLGALRDPKNASLNSSEIFAIAMSRYCGGGGCEDIRIRDIEVVKNMVGSIEIPDLSGE